MIMINTTVDLKAKRPETIQRQNSYYGNSSQWKDFDLKQIKQGAHLDITVKSPVIIVKDLKKKPDHFLLDFGTVEIKS